jgi:ATP-dependent Clp protease ATP-binding subunit ClpX
VKQYQKLLSMDGIALTFAPDMLDYIVDKAVEYKLGARGLRGLMETVMIDVMYDLPSSKDNQTTYEVTREYAAQRIEKANLNTLTLSGE